MISIDYGRPQDAAGLQLRLGVARGFFRDEGIDLNIKVIFGGPEIAAAYDSGALKVGEIGTPPATTAISKGMRFKIIGSGVRRRALQYLVATPEIKTWADFRGKTAAALTLGSCSYWYMRVVLQSHGLDPDRDVKIIGLGPRYSKLLEVFAGGEIQAAVISEPSVAIGESRGLFRIMQALTDDEYCPRMQWSVVVANENVIASEPNLLKAVLRASRRSYHYCLENPDEWAAFAADYVGIDRTTMNRALAREAPGLHPDCVPDMEGLQQAIDMQTHLGAIKKPMRAEEIVDLSFLPELSEKSESKIRSAG